MARILVIEDDPDIALALVTLLRRTYPDPLHADNGVSGLKAAFLHRPDLIVLDIGLPQLDGWEVLRRIRDVSTVPVLLLTAAGHDDDKVRGLRAGADDYLTKPFNNDEFLARVEALLRRAGGADYLPEEMAFGNLEFSPARHLVTVDGEPVTLTPQEFRLLAVFLRHQGQVLTQSQLLALVWDDLSPGGTERVKFAVLRLRKKLGWDDADASPLVAVRGVGYRLDAPEA
ncbi:MAG: response regulator transcription factor [Propioniciclava sp.]